MASVESRPYSGRVKRFVCERLHDSWRDLADVLEVEPFQRYRFTAGYEPEELWDWLAVRGRLGDLEAALGVIGRHDLVAVLAVEPEPVAPSEDTRLLLDLSAMAVRDADVLVDTGRFGRRDLRLSDLYVRRTVEELVRDRIRQRAICAVVGEPGTGKTSLLWALANRLSTDGTVPLFVKAGDLGTGMTATMIADAVRYLREDGREPVLMVDTLDVLLHRQEIPLRVVELLRMALSERVATVLTCRVVEARLLNEVQDVFRLDRLELLAYNQNELSEAIAVHARHFWPGRSDAEDRVDEVEAQVKAAVAGGLPLREICQNPLTLRMLFEVSDGGMPDIEIDTAELYDRYWAVRVRGDRRHGVSDAGWAGAEPVAEAAALVMLALGMPEAPADTFESELMAYVGGRMPAADVDKELEGLTRRGILKVDSAGTSVRFFHQTFMEYAAARGIAGAGAAMMRALIDRAAEEHHDPFLAAITHRAAVVCGRSTAGAERVGPSLQRLVSAEAVDVCALGLTAYAQSRYASATLAAAARTALSHVDIAVVDEYVRYLPSARHSDVDRVCGDLRTVWEREDRLPRWWVLDVLRRLAVRHPDAVIALLDDLAAYTWILDQAASERQGHGNPAIALIETLAPIDQAWAGDRFIELLAAFGSDLRTRHGLTRVLAAAARCVQDPATLEAVLAKCPGSGRKDPGVSDLERALAGCYLRAWRLRMLPAQVCCDRAVAATMTGSSLHSRAQLIAVSEVILGDPDGDRLIDELIVREEPQLQRDVVEHVLRPIVQGCLRPPVPGATREADRPERTDLCRRRVLDAVADLAQGGDTGGDRRSMLTALRDALDYSHLPPDVMAQMFGADGPALSTAAWLDPACAAAFVVPAALGGHEGATAALDEWCRRPPADGPVWRRQRQVICGRLQRMAAAFPEAMTYLLLDAARTGDPGFLVEPAQASSQTLAGFDDRLSPLILAFLRDPRPQIRTDGYRVLAAMIEGYAQPPDLTPALAAERDAGALNGILDCWEAALDHRSHAWPGGSDPALPQALQDLAERSREDSGLRTRAANVRQAVLCRMAPVRTAEERAALRQIIEAQLATRGRSSLRPLGYLISRMSEVDLVDASALLVFMSTWILGQDSPGASWKSTVAKRWRTPIKDVVERQGRSAWLAMMRDLAGGDQFLMKEAIDISLLARSGRPEDDLAAVLAEAPVTDWTRRAFAAARRRRHRIIGGASTWPGLADLYNSPEQR